ncbi:hypothetical protein TNCV_4076621 [Trichonephila clavipes]|nr:hypothetical protein TNCV_4076621 [Trichonephila clavipes]
MANNQSVSRHLDALPRSNHWEVGGRPQSIRGFSSGRPRGTTPADDRYIFFDSQKKTGGRQWEKSLDTTQATGRPISRFTMRPEDCTLVVCLHDALYGVCTFNACASEKAFSAVPGTPELERK